MECCTLPKQLGVCPSRGTTSLRRDERQGNPDPEPQGGPMTTRLRQCNAICDRWVFYLPPWFSQLISFVQISNVSICPNLSSPSVTILIELLLWRRSIALRGTTLSATRRRLVSTLFSQQSKRSSHIIAVSSDMNHLLEWPENRRCSLPMQKSQVQHQGNPTFVNVQMTCKE